MGIITRMLQEIGIDIIEGNLVDNLSGYSIIFNGRRLVIKNELQFDELQFEPMSNIYQANFIFQYFINKINVNNGTRLSYEGFITDPNTKKIKLLIKDGVFYLNTGYFNNICFAFIEAIFIINKVDCDLSELDKRW